MRSDEPKKTYIEVDQMGEEKVLYYTILLSKADEMGKKEIENGFTPFAFQVLQNRIRTMHITTIDERIAQLYRYFGPIVKEYASEKMQIFKQRAKTFQVKAMEKWKNRLAATRLRTH